MADNLNNPKFSDELDFDTAEAQAIEDHLNSMSEDELTAEEPSDRYRNEFYEELTQDKGSFNRAEQIEADALGNDDVDEDPPLKEY